MNLRNLAAYLQERFPPVNMSLFVVLFLTVRAVAGVEAGPGGAAPESGLLTAMGALAAVSFFFRLRVFDEEKDFAQDALHHPHRVLQTGRVTLRQLRALAWAGTLLEAGWAAAQGRPALLGWALALTYSLLMRAEFFVGGWLRRHLVLYAGSHLLIMPLVILWLWLAYTSGSPSFRGPLLPLLLGLSLLGGLAFELARKLHTPAQERAGVDSYSRALGYGPALAVTALVLLAGAATQARLLAGLGAGAAAYAVLLGLLGLTLLLYAAAARRPRELLLRRAELVVSLFMLTSYLALLAEVYGR
ncbi:hypothetical protein [uncultured Hymenobacter sp.]|uniref:hypothetical protein n=1 Tax=uncultured Hymenobacter sp. TaxID=170016 RepID=UPI0035CC021B